MGIGAGCGWGVTDGAFSSLFRNTMGFSGDRFLETGAVSGLSHGSATGCLCTTMAAADSDHTAFSYPLFWRHF